VRNKAFAAGLSLLPCAAFLAPLGFGKFYSFRDLVPYVIPLKAHAAAEAVAGRIPWYNPFNGCGELFLTNPQTGILYPFTYLFLLPAHAAVQLYLFLHLAAAAAGMALLVRSHGKSAPFSLAMGLGFGFSGVMLSAWDLPFNLGTTAWLPLILWSLRTRRRPLVPALFLALSFFAGEPVLFAFNLITVALFVLIEDLPLKRAMAGMGLGAVLIAGQAAWLVLGFLNSARLGSGAESFGGISWGDLAVLIAGPVSGLPFREAGGGGHLSYLPLPYLGAAALFFFLQGLMVRGRHRWYLLPMALFLLMSAGAGGPLGMLFGKPGLEWVRFPPRFLLCALPLVFLVALKGEGMRWPAAGVQALLLLACWAWFGVSHPLLFLPLASLAILIWIPRSTFFLPLLVLADLAAQASPLFFLQDSSAVVAAAPVNPPPMERVYTPPESASLLKWVYPYGIYGPECDRRAEASFMGYSNLRHRTAVTSTPHPLRSPVTAGIQALSAGECAAPFSPRLDPRLGVSWDAGPARPLVEGSFIAPHWTGSGLAFDADNPRDGECTVRLARLPQARAWVDGAAAEVKSGGPWVIVPLRAGRHHVEIGFVPASWRGLYLIFGALWVLFLCYAIFQWITPLLLPSG
jgi:hypothetical protein